MTNARQITVLSPEYGVSEGLIASTELGLAPGGTVAVRTLHGGRQEGVIEVTIDAGAMQFSLLPTRAMGIWWAKYKGRDLFWKSPVREAVHPMFVNLESNGGLGWLDGFCEGVVRCGLEFNGAPGPDEIIDDTGAPAVVQLPLHGRIGNTPATTVSVQGLSSEGKSILRVTGIIYEQIAQLEKYRLISCTSVAIGGNEILIHDEVTNLSGERIAPLELLYHINLGPPALSRGSRMEFRGAVEARDARAAKGLNNHASFGARTKGFTEQCYFIDLDAGPGAATGAMLVAPGAEFAVYERHNKRQLKCFTQWKQTGIDEYVNGLEPGTSLPNPRGVERAAGRLEFLKPNEVRDFDLAIGALDEPSAIQSMTRQLG